MKQTAFRAVFTLVVLVSTQRTSVASAQDLANELPWWMDYVNDSASIASLTIPGSHDSGALYESIGGTAKCQNLSIRAQLDIGVRYLDMRLRQYGNALVVHHGSVYQHQNFDDVLTQVVAFLAANPSETVLMEVSSEHTPENNTETYEQTFVRYANNPAYARYWWRHSYVPVMSEVRGKIVLLRRFSGSFGVSGGINVTGWRDNAQFTLYDTRNRAMNVQDYYRVNATTNDNKWSAITNRLAAASSDTSGTLFLNFTSGVKSILGIPNIPAVSNDINDRLYWYFRNSTAHHVHHGVVISDFVNADLVREELRPYFY